MIIWGVISTVTAEAKNFGGLLAIRFFLGFVEAAYFVRDTMSVPRKPEASIRD